MDEGLHENSLFAYYGFTGLQELLQKKNQLVKFHRLHGLNQARKLLSKATALSDQKRLLMAIASGKVNRVDRVISLGLRQKKGAHGLLASCLVVVDEVYKPKSFYFGSVGLLPWVFELLQTSSRTILSQQVYPLTIFDHFSILRISKTSKRLSTC